MSLQINVGSFFRNESSDKCHLVLDSGEIVTLNIANGRIIEPGQHEDNPVFVYWLWEHSDGFTDVNNFMVYEIEDADRVRFPELLEFEFVAIHKNEHGFVDYCCFQTRDEYNEFANTYNDNETGD